MQDDVETGGVLAIAGHNFVCFNDEADLEPRPLSSVGLSKSSGLAGRPVWGSVHVVERRDMTTSAKGWPWLVSRRALVPRVCSWSNDEEHLTSRPIWHVRLGWFRYETYHGYGATNF